MPEGDTIHRSATRLRATLLGKTLTKVEVPRHPRPWPAVGAQITGIEARGKHLLLATSDGFWLHTHQMMTGSWHLYAPGERWRKSPRAARVVLAVPGAIAVCFASPVVEVLDATGLARHRQLRQLGPDLCDPGADLDEATTRFGRLSAPDRPVGDALLDQRIACGVGNVYRCEVLLLHGLHPATAVGDLDTPTRHALLATAARLLRENLGSAPTRSTVPGGNGRLWVYGRDGAPCRRCGDAIASASLGDPARLAYWCPTCQRPDRRGPTGSVERRSSPDRPVRSPTDTLPGPLAPR